MSLRAELSPWDGYQKAISPDGRMMLELRLVSDRGDPREEIRSARPRVTDMRTRRVILDMWGADCDAVPAWPAEGGLMLALGRRRVTIAPDAEGWSLDGGEWRPIETFRAEDVVPPSAQLGVPLQPPPPKEPRKADFRLVLLAGLLLAALLTWAIWDAIYGRGLPRQWVQDPECKYGACPEGTGR